MHAEALPCASTSPRLSPAVPHAALPNPQHGQGTPPGDRSCHHVPAASLCPCPAQPFTWPPRTEGCWMPCAAQHGTRTGEQGHCAVTGLAAGTQGELSHVLASTSGFPCQSPGCIPAHQFTWEPSPPTQGTGHFVLSLCLLVRPPCRMLTCAFWCGTVSQREGAGQGGRVVTATWRQQPRLCSHPSALPLPA